MHARELVEFGALVAGHGALLIRQGNPLVERHVEQYWRASRCRHDRWGRALWKYRTQIETDQPAKAWSAVRPTVEEILASELLTRVWTAVSMAFDHRHATNHLEPIARSVLIGHLEARNRAMNVMVYGKGFTVEEGVLLNRLRRRVERWTDMLLAYIVCEHDVSELAFQPSRVRNFSTDLDYELIQLTRGQAWQLTLASARAAFHQGLTGDSGNTDLNQQITAAILACFPPNVFDSTGLLKSIWMLRLDQVSEDMKGLVEDLIGRAKKPVSRFAIRR